MSKQRNEQPQMLPPIWLHEVSIQRIDPEPGEGHDLSRFLQITIVGDMEGRDSLQQIFAMPLSVWNGILVGLTRHE